MRFIYALGIRNVGEETAHEVANAINPKSEILNTKQIINKLKSQTLEDWQKIQDVGPIVARSIYDYFQDKDNLKFIEKLLAVGVKIEQRALSTEGGVLGRQSSKEQKLQGQTFVFTGGLETLSRDEAKNLVREANGDVSESVSKSTSYVVTGLEPGSKYERAKQLGIKIISEKEFLNLIKG